MQAIRSKVLQHDIHTFVDMNFENLAFAGDLSALALLAAIFGIDAFSLPLALGAHRLHLLDETWAQLLHTHLNTAAATG